MKKLLAITLLFLTGASNAAIKNYKADITVRPDGYIEVRETAVLTAPASTFSRVYDTYSLNEFGLRQANNFSLTAPKTAQKHTDANTETIIFTSPKAEDTFKAAYTALGATRRFANAHELHFTPFNYPLYDVQQVNLNFALPAAALDIKAFSQSREIPVNISAEGNNYSLQINNIGENSLDVVVYLPKNVFVSAVERGTFSSEKKVACAAGLLTVLVIFYIAAWLALGVYDKKNIAASDGNKIPQNLSAGEMRIFYKKVPGQVNDRFKALSSAVLWLGTRGLIHLEKHGHEYKISQTHAAPATAEEKFLIKELFKYEKVFNSKEMQTADVKKLSASYVKFLEEKLGQKYFTSHRLSHAVGAILSAAFIVWAYLNLFNALPVTFFVFSAAAIFVSVFFSSLFNPFSKKGRVVMRDIEAFRKFLMDGENLDDVKLFEKYLPYALALGVENKWCRKFGAHLNAHTIKWYKSDTLSAAPSLVSALSNEIGSGFTNSFYYTAE